MYVLHGKCCPFAAECPSGVKRRPDKTARPSFESPLFDPDAHPRILQRFYQTSSQMCVVVCPPPPLQLTLPSLAAAHSQSARITPRSDLQSNNFEVQMGENILSIGLTPDPVAVARLPDASQRLESSVSGDLPLLQTWRWVWRRGGGITTVCAGTARVIYLKRHTVTRGARVV